MGVNECIIPQRNLSSMTIRELDKLLMRIRDRDAGAEEVARARELVQADTRLPEELREVALVEDIREDAVALLAVLGHEDGFGALMAEALLSESQEVQESSAQPQAQVLDLNEAMELELSKPFEWPVAEALASEAGHVDFAEAVLNALGMREELTASVGPPLRAEAGTVEVAGQVLERLEHRVLELPFAEALAAEAGDVELVGAVFEQLGLDVPALGIGGAIAEESGSIDLAAEVTASISEAGVTSSPKGLSEAIRAAAGDVDDLWPAIANAIAESDEVLPIREAVAYEAGDADLATRVMDAIERDSLGVVSELPPAANTGRWAFAAVVAIAAAAMVMFSVRLTIGELPSEPASQALQFAAAGELVVHDLEYSDNVQVFQVEGDEGAMIIWVDEEAVL
jgi:hypothetical protein